MGQSGSQRTCGNCGTLNDVSDQFCASCGYTLAGGPTGTIASIPNAPTLASVPGRRFTGTLAAGVLLGSRYRIVQLVGKGGFGAVYKAYDERFQARRTVAIKEMSDAHLDAQERAKAISNFRHEADVLVQLKHSNLPDVSDFFEEAGKAYLVMEFIDGQTLEAVQDNVNAPLDEPLVMGWALQLCDVLNYLHTLPQPIIFRDLKPPNIMVTRSNQIKLIDFGIARVFKSRATKDTATLGSRGYAPLEQYGHGQSDARSDIYALGATLYDLLTQNVPVDAVSRRLNPRALEKPRQLNPRISKETERIVLNAMEEDSPKRYQSAADVYRAIAAQGFTVTITTGMNTIPTSLSTIPANPPTIPGKSLPSGPIQSYPTQAGVPPTISAAPAQAAQSAKAGSPASSGSPVLPAPLVLPAPPGQAGQIGQSATLAAGPMTSTSAPGQNSSPIAQSMPPQSPVQAAQSLPQSPLAASVPSGSSQTPVAANPPSIVPPPYVPAPRSPSMPPSSPPRRVGRRALIGGGIGILLGGAGLYALTRAISSQGPSLTGSAGTITVNFTYSTEKKAWLEDATSRFHQANPALNNKAIQIQLNGIDNSIGSVDAVNQIVNGQITPVVWSPASDLEINRLIYEWQQKHPGGTIIKEDGEFQPQPLVKSPLVFAIWQDRLQTLLAHYNVQELDWQAVHDSLGKSWLSFGGQQDWGNVTFGQTLPTQSNSGLLTITLIAYAYFHEQNGLTMAQVADTGFWQHLDAFEQVVNGFGTSSGPYLQGVIGNGPSQADIVTTYENLVLTLQNQAQVAGNQKLLINYPGANLLSNHPFAILQGNWASDEQKMAALKFRDFLLSVPIQCLAVQYGFRPARQDVSVTDASIAGNPFVSESALFPHKQPESHALAQPPGGDVIDALITAWKQHYQHPNIFNG